MGPQTAGPTRSARLVGSSVVSCPLRCRAVRGPRETCHTVSPSPSALCSLGHLFGTFPINGTICHVAAAFKRNIVFKDIFHELDTDLFSQCRSNTPWRPSEPSTTLFC